MKIVVSGASGLVGRALVSLLTSTGHEVRRMVRRAPRDDGEIQWSPDRGELDSEAFEGVDAVVHLAGENIASGRWTQAKKKRIRDSRVNGTKLLAETLARCEKPPRVLVNASAIGYYGDRGDEELTEDSEPGKGYLPDVCCEWEAATAAAGEKGIRVALLRIGVVLSPDGGALQRMLTPFKLGAGGRIGSGKQHMSWIALDDLVDSVHHAIVTDSLAGAVNAVSPNPVTNAEFTKTLGKVLGRPTIFPLPGAVARLAFGEMADDLLLSSARVYPKKLADSGFSFRFAELEDALRHLLGKRDSIRQGS